MLTRCGGDLHPLKLGRVGERVPCPACGKLVKLRRPFNGSITGWVQVPIHNRAEKPAAWLDAFGKPHRCRQDAINDYDYEPEPLYRAPAQATRGVAIPQTGETP